MTTDTDATSLLAAFNCRDNIHLIIGTNPLAASRCGQSLNAGAKPVLIAPETAELHYGLAKRIEAGEVKWHKKEFQDNDLFTLGREDVGGVVDVVFVTSGPRDPSSTHISSLCKKNRIPINVVDAPHLCTFSLLSTHTDGPLQIGVTTNGRGCKLASRIRRDVAASLPPNLGTACARLGQLRRRIQQEDRLAVAAAATASAAQREEADHDDDGGHDVHDADDSVEQSASFNRLVTEDDADAAKTRRIRWLSQVCEYWPLKRLAAISDADVEAVLRSYATPNAHESALSHIAPASPSPPPSSPPVPTSASASAPPFPPPPPPPPQPPTPSPQCGLIILAGSGPGHPDLLTRATHKAIQTADLILADKLVPSAVLDLVPRRTQVRIARKFPGNADAAQDELHAAALHAARDQGLVVVRLKQGDPFLYGRGGEEVAYFRAHGVPADRVVVLPGVTSALSAPLFAGVPATMRDVADQVLVCTGTGKKGRAPEPPGYRAARTAVFLMALHRIEGLVDELTSHVEKEKEGTEGGRGERVLWPRDTPCAVIERASCPDQRVIRTTLAFVAQAIEAEGSRPPGLLVVGKACEALFAPEKGRVWTVEDGFRGLDFGEDVVLPA
ncbi:uroporphyrinogen-III C-methyltransferase [Sodiomyces alkalinus F11]|uniref:Uroporphyrinogen-III C-methyltransferase n=1 Tax=Sodiomyces alkalinus (strain CBS 110278 / VKM F-3762 / F11) TaxID=1314773 RepID=A0A3N2PJ57_SODAK|nr:uroporphyrinogen-III C-methyltransferase [Sodiomyces alkalinus F11]ROT34470.1 uroporphyrinogen-III C-methyltransferase [Sodiomyces alkalinus F11]